MNGSNILLLLYVPKALWTINSDDVSMSNPNQKQDELGCYIIKLINRDIFMSKVQIFFQDQELSLKLNKS